MVNKGLYNNLQTGELVEVIGNMEVETYPPIPYVVVVDSKNKRMEIREYLFVKEYVSKSSENPEAKYF